MGSPHIHSLNRRHVMHRITLKELDEVFEDLRRDGFAIDFTTAEPTHENGITEELREHLEKEDGFKQYLDATRNPF